MAVDPLHQSSLAAELVDEASPPVNMAELVSIDQAETPADATTAESQEELAWWHSSPALRLVFGTVSRIGSVLEWLFGVATLIVGLATLASYPLIQFLSLGYLLEVSGRMARTGRAREGFIGVRKAARIGGVVLGTWLLMLPVLLLARLSYVASLVDPDGVRATSLRVSLFIVTGLLSTQILWAWYRGGRLRHFFWPAPVRLFREIRQPHKYARIRDAVWDFVSSLRLPYYFWLGLRGALGTVAILFIPISLFVATVAVATPGGILLVLLGGLLLTVVLMYLPFLQAHFAAENRLSAMFEIKAVRQQFRRAPIVFMFSLLLTLSAALPLYLLKVEWTPREIAVLIGIVFVVFMFPARLLTGFAVGLARRREEPRHAFFRWLGRLLCFPTAAAYVFFLYFFRFFLWNGHMGLFEQHAFLLPIPFLGY